MSVSRGSSGEVQRASIVINMSDDGDVPLETVGETVADEDRHIIGWTPIGSTLPRNSTYEISVTGYMSRKEPRVAAEGSYSVNDKHAHIFTAGFNEQNDATNGVGYASTFNCETTMLPKGEYIEWNEDVPLIINCTSYGESIGEPIEVTIYWKEA